VASRFLREIPESLMRRVVPRPRAAPAPRGASYAGVRVAPAPAAAPLGPDSPWRIGQSVIHATFGAGVIVGAEGRGPEARVQVNFRNGGLKWLLLEYAKLTPA